MSPLTNLRTSPFMIPLTCVVTLGLVAPTAVARVDGPVPVNMSFGPASASAPAPMSEPVKPAAACPAAQEAIAGTSPDKYGEAARHFEQCARTSGDAGLWKKAGMARYSARQYAHAIQALDTYMRGVGPGGDPQGEAMLADARKNTATVRFSVVTAAGASAPERLRIAPREGAAGDEIDLPWSRAAVSFDVSLDPGQWTAALMLPGGGQVGPQDIQATRDTGTPQVVLFRVEAPAQAVPPVVAAAVPVEVKLSLGPAGALRRGVQIEWKGPQSQGPRRVGTATTSWPLAPGEWQLHLEAEHFAPQTRDLQVRPGEPHSLSLKLVRTREDKLRIGMSAGLGVAALGLLAGGLVGTIGGRRDYRAAVGRLDGSPMTASEAGDAALRAIRGSSNGVMLTTSAVGAGAAAITIAAGGSNRLLGAEIGVGGALLIAGIAWLVPAKRQYTSDEPMDDPGWAPDRTYFDEHRRPELAAAALIGLGAGLAAGAGVALVARKIVGSSKARRSATLTPMMAPRSVGLALQGTF